MDSVSQESRTVFPEERRILALVDVAVAYWEIDPDETESFFNTSLNSAISLAKQDKKNHALINHVLASAAKIDSKLAVRLNKKLSLEKELGNTDDFTGRTALDLLNENPEAAAQLVETFAPNGLQDGTASFFILSLAKKDISLSNRVHRTYVSRVAASESIPFEWILMLAGYAFGRSEYHSIDRRGDPVGASFLPIELLRADPAISNQLINLCFRRLSRLVELRNAANGLEIAQLNRVLLFSIGYLMPEVERFSSPTLASWQQLQQQALVGTTFEQSQVVQRQLAQIYQARARTERYSSNPMTPEQEAEASLENVEKITGTCERDVVYSTAALAFNSKRNFKRAQELTDKIENLKQQASVREVIFISIAESAIAKGEWDDADRNIRKVSSAEHRAILLLSIVRAMTNARDIQGRDRVVTELEKLVDKLSKPVERSGVLFSLAAVMLSSISPEKLEAQRIFENAITILNKSQVIENAKPSFPLKVSLSCKSEGTWHGGFKSISNSSLLDSMTVFAKEDSELAKQLADSIDDKVLKLRSQALVAKLAIRNRIQVSKKSP